METTLQILAEELNRPVQHVANVVQLLDEGATIPFIARYRQELHGAMDDTTLRTLEERLRYLRSLQERRETVKNAILEKEKLTEDLSSAIDAAKTLAEVEDLYRPFKEKRRTRASMAREKGLEPLAELLFAQQPDCLAPLAAASGYINPDKGVETAEEALAGASDILAEQISDDAALRKKLRERLDQTREVKDQEIYRQIDDLILEETRNRYVSLRRKEALRTELFNSIRKLDILQELIDDDSVTEIMVNGTEGIFLERNGRLLCWEKKIASKEKLEDMVQQIAGRCNRIVNESVPVADARLSDGSRVSLVLPPVALNGPVITIRRFPKNPIHMDRLVELGAVTPEVVAFLKALVKGGYNIFISGGTGSGKTTFLNALSDFIPKEERIITIEDNAELQIQGAENLVRLEARQANTEGKNAVTIRDLIKASLRMRPDRIVVGEVRGEEALDMIQSIICTIL